MDANEIAEYTMYLQLYKQYKLDCIAKGTVPKELVTFLGQLKAETHGKTFIWLTYIFKAIYVCFL